MQEQQPTVQVRDCDEEACGRCPINGLDEDHGPEVWHGVVSSALSAIDRYGVTEVRLPWLATAIAVQEEAHRNNEDASAKSLGSVAAAECLRMKMEENDFEKLNLDP